MTIQFHGLTSALVATLRTRQTDAYGLPIERRRACADGCCRHCLRPTPPDRDMLILAYRPFNGLNAYTETGPIFLCADTCEAAKPSAQIPAILASPSYIARGYSADERILYGTGKVTPTRDIPAYATKLLENPQTAFVDIRSAANNCFQCRVTRA